MVYGFPVIDEKGAGCLTTREYAIFASHDFGRLRVNRGDYVKRAWVYIYISMYINTYNYSVSCTAID